MTKRELNAALAAMSSHLKPILTKALEDAATWGVILIDPTIQALDSKMMRAIRNERARKKKTPQKNRKG
jgi:hypothetical protein